MFLHVPEQENIYWAEILWQLNQWNWYHLKTEMDRFVLSNPVIVNMILVHDIAQWSDLNIIYIHIIYITLGILSFTVLVTDHVVQYRLNKYLYSTD